MRTSAVAASPPGCGNPLSIHWLQMSTRMPARVAATRPRGVRAGHDAARRRRLAVVRARRRLGRSPRRRRLAILLPILATVGIVALWGGGMAALAALQAVYGGIPDSRELAADSMVYDRSGKLIADLHPPGETRIPVPLSHVAKPVIDATVAVEDRNFWSEGAVDVGRLAGAAWTDLRHGSSEQGASTITEQLAKVLYLDSTRSIDRKLHEIFIARHLAETETKPQILEQYLNDINYGHGAYGIEAAARTYFGIPASKLDVAQASLLAGLPNAPYDLDPINHPQGAEARQQVVLDAMVATGALNPAQETAILATPLVYADGSADNINTYPITNLRIAQDVGDALHVDPYRAGLSITSTIDSASQDAAQKVVTDQVKSLGSHHVTDGALVAVDPSSGDILAYVGSAGPGFPASQIDMAAHPRQPGSTFKLFTYATAFGAKAVTMASPVADAPLTLPRGGGSDGQQPYTVHNYDMTYHGTLPVKKAFANSLNIPAVKVEQLVGVDHVVQTAQAMGVTTLDQPANTYGSSLTLGTYPVPLWQMAQAGTVFANGGKLTASHIVASVKDDAGNELLPGRAPAKQVIDPGVADIVNAVLTDDSNRVMSFGAGSDLTLSGHLVSAKTGTTQDFRDNLTVGWNPHLTVATWVGNADNSPMNGTTGLTGAAPVWHQVMARMVGSQPDGWSAPPSDITVVGSDHFLTGTGPQTGAATGITRSGDCRYWSVGGSQYWYCGSGQSGLPGDPGPSGDSSSSSTGGGAAGVPTPDAAAAGTGQGGGGKPCHKHCP